MTVQRWLSPTPADQGVLPCTVAFTDPAVTHLRRKHALSTLQPHYSCSGRLLVGRAGPSFHIATAASLTMPTVTMENKLKTGQVAESHIPLTWDCKK